MPFGRWALGECNCNCGGGACNVTIDVDGCGAGVSGATVTIKSGGSTVASGTTSGGTVALSIPSAGTYEVVVSASGYPPYDQNLTLSCSGTYAINLTAGYVCCGTCIVPDTLHLTDGGGGCTLTWNGSSSWIGCYQAAVGSGSTPCGDPGAGCQFICTPGGSCTIVYTITCAGNGQFSVNRQWSVCEADCFHDPTYCQDQLDSNCNTVAHTCDGCTDVVCGNGSHDSGGPFAATCTAGAISFSGSLTLGTFFGCDGTNLSSPVGASISVSS